MVQFCRTTNLPANKITSTKEVSEGAVWMNWAEDRVTRVREPPPSSYTWHLNFWRNRPSKFKSVALKFNAQQRKDLYLREKTKQKTKKKTKQTNSETGIPSCVYVRVWGTPQIWETAAISSEATAGVGVGRGLYSSRVSLVCVCLLSERLFPSAPGSAAVSDSISWPCFMLFLGCYRRHRVEKLSLPRDVQRVSRQTPVFRMDVIIAMATTHWNPR